MLPEFQKIMDRTLHKTENTFSFIDCKLIVTKTTKEGHMKLVEEAGNQSNKRSRNPIKFGNMQNRKTRQRMFGHETCGRKGTGSVQST